MTKKTLTDCAKCSHLLVCDAHVIDGGWKHRQGIDPCIVVIDDDKELGFV